MEINCKLIVEEIKQEIREEVMELMGTPSLLTIQVGNNFDSDIYVSKKKEVLEGLGLNNTILKLPDVLCEAELIDIIKTTQKNYTGVLVQMPLPAHINAENVIKAINSEKDVDGFCPKNIGNMFRGNLEEAIIPCTPLGVMELINRLDIDLKGKRVLIIGRSNLLGKPLQNLLINKDAIVLTLHSKMEDRLEDYLIDFNPYMIISCVGRRDLLKKEMFYPVKPKYLIDCAINRNSDNKIVGDFKKEDYSYLNLAHINYTPVPGGVGVFTTAMVAKNLLKCYKLQGGK